MGYPVTGREATNAFLLLKEVAPSNGPIGRNNEQVLSLIAFLLLLAACCFGVSPARAGDSEDATFVTRYSETWPAPIRLFARREWVFGDHDVQKGEAIYLARALFPEPDKAEESQVRKASHAMSGLLSFMPGEQGAKAAFVAEMAKRTPATQEEVRRWLKAAAQQDKKWAEQIAEARENVVRRGGKYVVKQTTLQALLPYVLVRTEGVTPEVFGEYMQNNSDSVPYCLDAVKFHPQAAPYGRVVIELIETKKLGAEHLGRAVRLGAFLGTRYWNSLVSIPPDNNVSMRSYWGILYRQLAMNTRHIMPQAYKSNYEKSKKDGRVLAFFREQGTILDDEWLVYRYHGKEITEWLGSILGDEVAPSYKEATKLVNEAKGALELAGVYDGYLPARGKILEMARKRAFGCENPDRQAIALILLDLCVQREDLPRLVEVAHDQRQLSGGDDSAPRIALMAEGLIERHFVRPDVLRKLALDDGVPREVSEAAAETYERWTGEKLRDHEPEQ